MAGSSAAGARARDGRTPEPLERRSVTPASQSGIDHSRLPPEVAAVLARTPRTGAAVATASYDSTAEYQNPILRGKAPLRQSPRARRSKSRDRSINDALTASAALATELATDFVERGRFSQENMPRVADTEQNSRDGKRSRSERANLIVSPLMPAES